MVLFLKWFGVLFSVNTDSYGLLLHNGKVLEGPLSEAPSNTRKPGKVRETLLCMCGQGKNEDVKIPPTFSTVSVASLNCSRMLHNPLRPRIGPASHWNRLVKTDASGTTPLSWQGAVTRGRGRWRCKRWLVIREKMWNHVVNTRKMFIEQYSENMRKATRV